MIALRSAPEPFSRRQVDNNSPRGIHVTRGIISVAAEEVVGTLAAHDAAHDNVVATSAIDPIVAAEAEDRVVAIRYAVTVKPPPRQRPEKIRFVGSVDPSHGHVSRRL